MPDYLRSQQLVLMLMEHYMMHKANTTVRQIYQIV
jgi:hypothetical protein